MAKPDQQTIELRAGLKGLTAWVGGKYLGGANVKGDTVTVTMMARQVEKGPIKGHGELNHPLES